ncbi:hypothetical protein ACVXG7_22800 [Enterobacter hormaechei]
MIAFNGRFATLPQSATTQTTIHLIHGRRPGNRAFACSSCPGDADARGRRCDAGYRRRSGHAIDDRSMQFALDYLRYTVPKHYFDEALSGAKPNDDDIVEFI